MKISQNFNKSYYFEIFCILLLGISLLSFRYLYSSSVFEGDTPGYTSAIRYFEQLFGGSTPELDQYFVHRIQTPLYPAAIAVIQKISGDSWTRESIMLFLNSLFYLISLLVVWKIMGVMQTPFIPKVLATLAWSTHYLVLQFGLGLVTDMVWWTWGLLIIYLSILYWQPNGEKWRLGLGLAIAFFLGILIKEAIAPLIIFFIIFGILSKNRVWDVLKKSFVIMLPTLILTGSVFIFFTFKYQFNYFEWYQAQAIYLEEYSLYRILKVFWAVLGPLVALLPILFIFSFKKKNIFFLAGLPVSFLFLLWHALEPRLAMWLVLLPILGIKDIWEWTEKSFAKLVLFGLFSLTIALNFIKFATHQNAFNFIKQLLF